MRALDEEPTARGAIERLFREAVRAYYLPGKPRGCMVVAAAINCSKTNEPVMNWLAELRRARIAAIAARLRQGVASGEIKSDTDVQALADYCATVLNGMSIQARDGVPKKRLLASIAIALRFFDSISV